MSEARIVVTSSQMAYLHVMNKPAKEERQAFSTRLKLALASAQFPLRPSVLAREFNLRARGMEVTPHGARKWLVGEAFPSQQRLLVLANWLNVQMAWLRFGTQDGGETAKGEVTSDEQLQLLQEINGLSGRAQEIVRYLVDSLAKLEMAAGQASAQPEAGRRINPTRTQR